MPAPLTVSEYCGLLARTRLVPESEVQSLHQKWRANGGGTDVDLESFRKFLVQNRHLTEYQAALVGRGHTDGFFVGGFVILDRIGKGQTAGVYKAIHTSGQIVALKVLPGSKAKQPNVLSRFQREGRLLAQIDHPNVVRAFHVGQTGSVHFIAMEHLDGESLEEVLVRRKKLPAPEAVRLMHQALGGLQHLHEKRMVHRDLKPSNLMLTWPGRMESPTATESTLTATLKILDIGIGRELFSEDSSDTRDFELTAEGSVLGTPDYLAPEQARDARTADVRSDIYSLGCVLFHLITGRTPYSDKNVMGQMVKHATEPMPRLPADVPNGLQEVLDGMTAKSPDDRYQTGAEAAVALEPFLPKDAPEAESTLMLPAFKEWLESESGTEPLPAEVRNLPIGGSATAKALPPPPPAVSKPSTQPTPKKSQTAKPGASSGTVPAISSPKPNSGLHSVPAPKSLPPVSTPPRVEEIPEIDVELVTLPPPVPMPVRERPVERSLFDLDRRDFIMLGVGASGVLTAVVMGVGLASLLRPSTNQSKDTAPKPGEVPEPEPKPEPEAK